MGKVQRPKPKSDTRSERKNGKKPKQHPKVNRATGKTQGGYSPEALERRSKRKDTRLTVESPILKGKPKTP